MKKKAAKPVASEADVLAFMEAIYPGCGALALMSFNEKVALTDATKTIDGLRRDNADLAQQVEMCRNWIARNSPCRGMKTFVATEASLFLESLSATAGLTLTQRDAEVRRKGWREGVDMALRKWGSGPRSHEGVMVENCMANLEAAAKRPARVDRDTLCVCGHRKADHIYEEGACRPGFVCPQACQEFRRG